MALLRQLRREISDIDRRIFADPAALTLARAEGMADRIGRESQAIEDMLRARDASDGIRKHHIQSPDSVGRENQPAVPHAQNGLYTAKDEPSSSSPDIGPSYDQSDAPTAQEGGQRKLRPRKSRKPDRSR